MYKVGDRILWNADKRFKGIIIDIKFTELRSDPVFFIKWDHRISDSTWDWFPGDELVDGHEENDIMKDLCSK